MAIKRRTLDTTKKEKRYAYDMGKKNIHGELICKYCNAVYEKNHWDHFENLKPEFIDKLKQTVCPACHEERNHVSDGVLILTGTFIKPNAAELQHQIINMAKNAEVKDILNRVERIELNSKNQLIIYTTKNQLAHKIGKALASAHKGGNLVLKWGKGEKALEVIWHKDLSNK